jgi:hypothetical protein
MGSHHRLTPRDSSRPFGVPVVARPVALAVMLALGPALPSCQCEDKAITAAASRARRDVAHPVDRLAPGELGASSRVVFGFNVPLGMKVDSETRDSVYISGTAGLEPLARYVRDRVAVSHVEVTGSRFVFDNARIKGGDPNRTYLFELVRRHRRTQLMIRDKTPPSVVDGLSEPERWRRAGLTPDGQQLDPLKLE